MRRFRFHRNLSPLRRPKRLRVRLRDFEYSLQPFPYSIERRRIVAGSADRHLKYWTAEFFGEVASDPSYAQNGLPLNGQSSSGGNPASRKWSARANSFRASAKRTVTIRSATSTS